MIDFLIVIFSIKNDGKKSIMIDFLMENKYHRGDGKNQSKMMEKNTIIFDWFCWSFFFIEVLLIFFWFWLIFQYVCVAWLAFFIVVSMCLRIEMESETKKFTLWRLPSWRKMCARVCILYSISVAISTASFSLSLSLGALGTRYGSTQQSLVSEMHFYIVSFVFRQPRN